MLNILIKIYFIVCLVFYGGFFISEIIAKRLPNSRYGKWWRKNIVGECEKCD